MTIFKTRARALVIAAGLAGSLLPLGFAAHASPADTADAVEVYERDVFVAVGSTLRNPTVDTDPGAPLFTNTGVGVGRTWGEWSAATAASRAAVIGGPNQPRTDIRLSLGGLVPGGLYSVYWGTIGPDSEQALCPGVERTLPLDGAGSTAKAPAPNAFVVDATGAADFHGRVDGDLFDATQVFVTVVHHLFGQTSYPFPNLGEYLTQGGTCRSSFGEDSMRHLIILQKW